MTFRGWPRLIMVAVGALSALVAAAPVLAQFGPPSTVFGSIADERGPVAPDLRVEAYVGNTLCGVGATQFTGDGAAKVTVYWVDVVAREQTAGCGSEGAEVRVKIGDRFASQTAQWRSGPVRLDVTFGNVSPVPIPTFTPTPPGAGRSATPGTQPTPASTQSAQATGSATAQGGEAATPTPGKAGAEVRPGGLTTATGTGAAAEDGGFPLWGVLVIALGVIGLGGVAVGVVAARRSRDGEDAVS